MRRLAICILLLLALAAPALALTPAEAAAELYDRGLFKGTGTDGTGAPVFDLDSTMTRQEALVMLLRLLGREAEALACDFPSPYPDVAPWAAPYVGYAWVTGLTQGAGNGLFLGAEQTTAAQYATFLLRALGYSSPGDFAWDRAVEKAAELGLPVDEAGDFTRGDGALAARLALDLQTKSGKLLVDAMAQNGAVGAPYKNTNPVIRGKGGSSRTAIRITDEQSLGVNWRTALKAETSLDIQPDWSVQVLIISTHATEAFTPSDGLLYKASGKDRTLDPDRNMLRLGQVVADSLKARGIGAIALTEVMDYPQFYGGYDRYRPVLRDLLQQYPNVQMILDLHRDSALSGGKPVRTVCTLGDREIAQLMLVAGTDFQGWQENLGTALRLHDALEQATPGIMRPLILRNSRYNQDLTPGSILVEVGTDGNSLTEALYAARLLADGLAKVLLEE